MLIRHNDCRTDDENPMVKLCWIENRFESAARKGADGNNSNVKRGRPAAGAAQQFPVADALRHFQAAAGTSANDLERKKTP